MFLPSFAQHVWRSHDCNSADQTRLSTALLAPLSSKGKTARGRGMIYGMIEQPSPETHTPAQSCIRQGRQLVVKAVSYYTPRHPYESSSLAQCNLFFVRHTTIQISTQCNVSPCLAHRNSSCNGPFQTLSFCLRNMRYPCTIDQYVWRERERAIGLLCGPCFLK